MAKVQIKSEKLTSFGEIFMVMALFDSMLSSVIDSTLGLRCKLFGYQYSERTAKVCLFKWKVTSFSIPTALHYF